MIASIFSGNHDVSYEDRFRTLQRSFVKATGIPLGIDKIRQELIDAWKDNASKLHSNPSLTRHFYRQIIEHDLKEITLLRNAIGHGLQAEKKGKLAVELDKFELELYAILTEYSNTDEEKKSSVKLHANYNVTRFTGSEKNLSRVLTHFSRALNSSTHTSLTCKDLINLIKGLEKNIPCQTPLPFPVHARIKLQNFIMRYGPFYRDEMRRVLSMIFFLGTFSYFRSKNDPYNLNSVIYSVLAKLYIDHVFENATRSSKQKLSSLAPVSIGLRVFEHLAAFGVGGFDGFSTYSLAEALNHSIPKPLKHLLTLLTPHFGIGFFLTSGSLASHIPPMIPVIQDQVKAVELMLHNTNTFLKVLKHPFKIPGFLIKSAYISLKLTRKFVLQKKWKKATTAITALAMPIFITVSAYSSPVMIHVSGLIGALLMAALYTFQLLLTVSAVFRTTLYYHEHEYEEQRFMHEKIMENIDPDPDKRIAGTKELFTAIQEELAAGRRVSKDHFLALVKIHIPSLRCYTVEELSNGFNRLAESVKT